MNYRRFAFTLLAVAVALVLVPHSCGEPATIATLDPAKHANEVRIGQARTAAKTSAAAVKRTKDLRDVAASQYAIVRDGVDLAALPLPAVKTIQAADAEIHADSIHIDSLNVDRAAVAEERDAERERAELAQDELAIERASRPRFGFRAGVIVTLSAVAALLLIVK